MLHHGLQISVHHDRAGALVFAELGKNLVRDGERHAELFQRARRRHSQSSDWRRRTAAKLQLPRDASGEACPPETASPAATALAGFRRHCAVRSFTPKRKSVGNQRLDAIEKKIVKLGARLAADLDGVFKTGGCDQRHARALALQQSIGADRGAVQQDHRTARADLVSGPRRSPARGRQAWRKPSACGPGRARSRRSR